MSTVDPNGPQIAEGRDSVIYEHGPQRVLRAARDGRSLVAEAEVMTYARSRGFPVPRVHDAGPGYLVMDRITGPTMLDDAITLRLRRHGALLAQLHQQLHGIPAPHWLARHAPLEGDRLLHGDLHPLNVLMTDEGPMVIDWSNASRGAPAFDVADAWSLFACADPPDIPVAALVVPVGRRLFLRGFLDGVDRAAAARAMPAVVRERMSDPNISDTEKRRMKRLAAGLTGS